MTSIGDRLVEDYLKRLKRELGDLPRARRRELTDEIAGHIAEARANLDVESEAEIRTSSSVWAIPRRSPPRSGSVSPCGPAGPAGSRS
jgi:HAAS